MAPQQNTARNGPAQAAAQPAAHPSPEEHRVRLALLAYNQYGLDEIRNLVVASGIDGLLEVTGGDLAKHSAIECDMAMAVFTVHDDPERYISDLAGLRLVRKIPVVFAVISEGAQERIGDYIPQLPTGDILNLPEPPGKLIKTVMTQVVSQKIRTEKKALSREGRGPRRLGEVLVEHGLITPLQLKKALDYQKGTDLRLGESLVVLGYIDEEQKNSFLASQLGVEQAKAKQYASADINTVALIPEHIARRNTCIALEKDEVGLVVAMMDVLDLDLLDRLRDITDMTIVPVLGSREDIEEAIERYYRDVSSQQDATELVADLGEVEYMKEEEEELSVEEAAAAGAEVGIVKLVNMLLTNAVKDRASDIHIEPGEKDLLIRYRVDGDLRRVMTPPKQSHQAIITRIKILSDLDIANRRTPQDGSLTVKMGHRQVDVRVSILPTIFGEKAVLRILDKDAFEKSVDNLGFTKEGVEVFESQITKPYGMIIVTGPTGSGKSTTLYTAIQVVQSATRNIITVEDPVEFVMPGITQVNVNTKTGLTFAAALRSILRQDPDIVLIGEVRDGETADIAIKMALTGHLVFSTLHTNDAASSIARFVDIGIPPLLLGSALNLVVAQRLVRRICSKCKVEYSPEPELIEQLGIGGSGKKFFRGEGCVNCNGSGYSGRLGLFEMLTISRSIRKMILRNAATVEIQEQAEKEGMQTLRQAGIRKILDGETTVEQVIAVTTEI